VRTFLAVLLAALASSLYALSTSLQALEAREAPLHASLRSSLLTRLARRPVWLAGAAAGLAAWGLQAAALALASVALVQPALGLGLVVLLVLGARLLGEVVGLREVAGALAIGAGVALLAWSAPPASDFTSGGTWAIGVAFVVVAALPQLLRLGGRAGGLETSVSAGLGWAWVGLGTALVDAALADGRLLAAAVWAAAVGVASWATLVSEMTALQRWPATRSVPIAFGLEMVLPAAAAPFLATGDPRHGAVFAAALALAAGGAVVLGANSAVTSPLYTPDPWQRRRQTSPPSSRA